MTVRQLALWVTPMACAAALALPAAGLQSPTNNKELSAMRSPGCEDSGLSQDDRLACAREWEAAKDDQERAAITERYAERAKGNRVEGDGVPTVSPPRDTSSGATVDVPPNEVRESIPTRDTAWLITVGGGAAVLGLGIAYGVVQSRRRKTAAAKAAQDRGTRAGYSDK
jgi:hypothetical protein